MLLNWSRVRGRGSYKEHAQVMAAESRLDGCFLWCLARSPAAPALLRNTRTTWPRRAALRVFLNRLAPRAAARALLRSMPNCRIPDGSSTRPATCSRIRSRLCARRRSVEADYVGWSDRDDRHDRPDRWRCTRHCNDAAGNGRRGMEFCSYATSASAGDDRCASHIGGDRLHGFQEGIKTLRSWAELLVAIDQFRRSVLFRLSITITSTGTSAA